MREVVRRVITRLKENGLAFAAAPIVIGGMAMEYYGMRKAGADIDLLISNEDYQILAEKYPDKRKDLWGDLGVVIGEFEIWRSIALLDYDFFTKDAVAEENILVVSIDRLLWMRVCAMGVEKYRKDLDLMKAYYYKNFSNQGYLEEAKTHENVYAKTNGAVFGGKYDI